MTDYNFLIAMEVEVVMAFFLACAFALYCYRQMEVRKKGYQKDLEDIKRGRYGV